MLTRRFAFGACALAVLVLAAFTLPDDREKLPIGSKAPMTDVEMMGTDGEMHTLASAASENGLLVMFSCNTCPWVKAWEDRYNTIADAAAENGIGMIAVNSNAAYRTNGDGFEDMKERATDQAYRFPYVVDEGSALADAFGATKTPDIFLFDADMKLVYRGAIDDNAKNADAVESHYLMNAMTSMVEGQPIETAVTKSIGCTIKRTES